MQAMLLQDLTTVSGASGSSIIQSAAGWLDLGEVEDVTIVTDVREKTTGVTLTMTIETAPAADNGAFVSLVSFNLAAGLRTDVVPASLAKVPAARYLRWSLSMPVGATTDATFRIWVAGYGWRS